MALEGSWWFQLLFWESVVVPCESLLLLESMLRLHLAVLVEVLVNVFADTSIVWGVPSYPTLKIRSWEDARPEIEFGYGVLATVEAVPVEMS